MKKTHQSRSSRWLPLLVAAVLLAAGCSDSEDGTEAGIDPGAVDELLEDTESAEDPPDAEDPPADDSSDEDQEFSGDDSGEFCDVASELDETTNNFGDSTDPADVEAMMKEMLDGFDRAEAAAPDEIRDAVRINADAFRTLDEELAKVGYSILDLDLSVLNNLETEDFTTAEDDLDLFLFEICGIGDGPDTDEPIDSEPLPEGTARDLMAEQLVDGGFTAAEVECLLGGLDPADGDLLTDPQAALAIFTECEISLERLAELGG